MATNNNDRLSALRGGGSTAYVPKIRLPMTQRFGKAAGNAPVAVTTVLPVKRQMSTYNCCCCGQDFTIDTTDDPDPRPSPLGDRCGVCRAAGVERPFEQSGITLADLYPRICRFCKGDHWAMNCPDSK